MLSRPEWSIPKVQPDVFSIESLIAWLEKQPADQRYQYCYPTECVVAQYLKAHGIKNYTLGYDELDRLGWHHIAQDHTGSPQDWTFGGALSRAKSAQQQRG